MKSENKKKTPKLTREEYLRDKIKQVIGRKTR